MYACATHAVFSGEAVERIAASGLRELVVTDSIPISTGKKDPKIKVISLAPLIAEAIVRIHRGQSVGALFTSELHFTQEMLLWAVERAGERPAGGGNGRPDGQTETEGQPGDTDSGTTENTER